MVIGFSPKFGNVPKSWALFIKHEMKVIPNLNIQQKGRTRSKGYHEFKPMTKVFISTPQQWHISYIYIFTCKV